MATICMHHVMTAMRGADSDDSARNRLLISAGINPLLTTDSSRRVSTEQVARLFKSVQIKLDDEFMGFSQQGCRVGAFRTMCELVSHSQTLGELLEKAIDFYRLLSQEVTMSLDVIGGRAVFAIDHASQERDPDHFLREFLLVIWHRFPSWFIGDAIRLRETHFSFPMPGHHRELQVMFPGELRYNQIQNRLIYDAHYLDKPLVRTQEEVDEYARNAPADVMTIPGVASNLEHQIQRIVKTTRPGRLVFPHIDNLAQQLGLGSQTLYRQLKLAGTSYQKIKDDIRRETAINALINQGMSVEKVSELVGFSEARSFTRAFRQWTGMSPRRYRMMVP